MRLAPWLSLNARRPKAETGAGQNVFRLFLCQVAQCKAKAVPSRGFRFRIPCNA